MPNTPRKIAFVLASSDHGTMIVNRLDYRMVGANSGFGVGFQILERSSFDLVEVEIALSLLDVRRKHFGDGVVALDCGANIGVHTIEWAKRLTGWGSVIAIEAQERIYYALAGNLAINNCFNARAIHAAVASSDGELAIPNPNYLEPGSFGSLELRQREKTEFIGQTIDYSSSKMVTVPAITLDSLRLGRVDLIKIDVEGMEFDVLEGARGMIENHRPILIVESIKSDAGKLKEWISARDYAIFTFGINYLAIHASDPCRSHINGQAAKS